MKLPLGQEWSDTQLRYIAYCLMHNAASPDEMIEFDRRRFPGGCMGGYICWNSGMWREWATLVGADLNASRSSKDHKDYSEWLLLECFAEWLLLEYEPSPRTINPKRRNDDPAPCSAINP